MPPALLIALLNFVAEVGLPAAVEFFKNRGATLEEAIAALEKAHSKSLADYIAEDAAARLKATAQATTHATALQ